MKKIILAILVLVFLPIVSFADGFFIFDNTEKSIMESGQRAIIFHEDGVETLVLTTQYKGDTKDFSWIIPLPNVPEINEVSDDIFNNIDELTKVYRYASDSTYVDNTLDLGGDESNYFEQSVELVMKKSVGYYDISVVSASESGALSEWLNNYNYKFPEEHVDLLDEYVENDWYFVAIKIDNSKANFIGQTSPLSFKFEATEPVFPLKLSQISAPLKNGRVVMNDYFDEGDKFCLDTDSGKNYDEAGYTQNGDQGNYSFKVTTSYDYCRENYDQYRGEPDYYLYEYYCEDDKLIHKSYDCTEVGKICEYGACINPEDSILDSTKKDEGVSIELFVISDQKKYAKNGSAMISYANWFDSEDIESLASDSNGQSWIDLSSTKYFVTRLSMYDVFAQEMFHDLNFKNANDNAIEGVLLSYSKQVKYVIFFTLVVLVFVFGWLLLFNYISKASIACYKKFQKVVLFILRYLMLLGSLFLLFCSYVLLNLIISFINNPHSFINLVEDSIFRRYIFENLGSDFNIWYVLPSVALVAFFTAIVIQIITMVKHRKQKKKLRIENINN